jgi:hypothetical protein
MQAILNNYELNIQDRVNKYLVVRSESADNTGMIEYMIRFILGEPSVTTKQQQRISHQKTYKRSNDNNGDFQPLVDADGMEGKESPIKEAPSKTEESSLSGQYFQKLLEEVELNESGLSVYPVYQFDRYFAAGMVSMSSSIHSLLCQCYFRPYIADVIKSLTTNVIHLRVPETWTGREYGEYWEFCMSKGYILIGLYRNGSREGQSGDKSETPFVYTNPRSEDIVKSEDLVFALRGSSLK